MKFQKAVLVNIQDEHFDQKYWDMIDELVETRVSIQRDDPKFFDELKDCDCLMLSFQVPTDKDVFDAAPNLKLVNVLATAYGTVNLEEAKKRNVPVCNLGGYSTESVAEFTIAAFLDSMRNMDEGKARAKAGNYSGLGIRSRELKASDFGVIGLGNIGNRVAELAAGFGANVSYWSRAPKDTPFTYKKLDDLLASCQYTSVNVAENEETTGLLNAENLALIKPDSILMSTVPPAVIDFDALAQRLSKGDIIFISDHGDEMTEKQLAILTKLDNCVLLPGMGYNSDEATIAKQETFIGNIRAALDGQPQNQVN